MYPGAHRVAHARLVLLGAATAERRVLHALAAMALGDEAPASGQVTARWAAGQARRHVFVVLVGCARAVLEADHHVCVRVAALLELDHVAVRDQLAKGAAVLDVLEQLVDLLGKVAIDHVGAAVLVVGRDADLAVALVACDLPAKRRERVNSERSE